MESTQKYVKKDLSMKLQKKEKFASKMASFKAGDIFAAMQEKKKKDKKDAQARETKMMREDPEAHIRKLKAQIKLKAVKMFQEDIKKKEEEEEKSKQPVVVIKDKFGRIIDKEGPKLMMKKQPSINRKPIKKKPPQRLRSFTEEQMKFYTNDDIFRLKST